MKIKSVELIEIEEGIEQGYFKFKYNKGQERDLITPKDGLSKVIEDTLKIKCEFKDIKEIKQLIVLKTKCGKTMYFTKE